MSAVDLPQKPRQRYLHSLLDKEKEDRRADQQLFLFLGTENLPKIDRSQPAFDYTGERLYRDRPEIYRMVVELLAEDTISVRQICRVCHVTDGTVRAVEDREGISIAAQKGRIIKNIRHALRVTSERMLELAPAMNAHDATIAVGVLTEKHELLSGGATARVVTASADNILEAFMRFHEQTEKIIDAKVIEPGQIGSGAGNAEQKALPASGDRVPTPSLGNEQPECETISRTPPDQSKPEAMQGDSVK